MMEKLEVSNKDLEILLENAECGIWYWIYEWKTDIMHLWRQV